MASRRNATALLQHYGPRLLRFPNVVAVAIGKKQTKGRTRKTGWCIRVHVTTKTSRPKKRVPPVLGPPRGRAHLGSIETDVIETGSAILHGQVRPGFPVRIKVRGVVGCLLRDHLQQDYILTAGHVVDYRLVVDERRNGNLKFGAQPHAYVTTPDGVESLAGPCVRCSGRPPLDLALVLLTVGRAVPIARISGVRDLRQSPLRPGESIRVLRARGAFTTWFHEGADADGMVTFEYPRPTGTGTIAVTYREIVFYPRSGDGGTLTRGDSGSAVVDCDNRLLGIHIGASTRKQGADTHLLGYALPTHVAARWASGFSVLTPAGPVAWQWERSRLGITTPSCAAGGPAPWISPKGLS
ncbi:MAG: trypsin-like peptidase domain-containing protein [Phycisphaerae bacterium]|nr:trypsin-like peptidase domain-containing protein [Phycisphaerae bacterium]